jgi:hypothetical protein
MRLRRPRIRTCVLVLGAIGLLALIWYLRPQIYDTVRRADRLTVYEGLPHPMYEEVAFRDESKTKPTRELAGFWFYRDPLVLKSEVLKTLRGLLGRRSTYRSYSGEKKCGGFHPDFAVEWSTGGKVYLGLICFGCSEARFEGPTGESIFYDLRLEGHSGDRSSRLLEVLKPYRKNRPPHERFGIGPLAHLELARSVSDRLPVG